MIRLVFALAAFLAWWTSIVVGAERESGSGRHVNIGVRVDAGPFAWLDPDTDSFRGYLVDLCTEAVTRAGYTFRLRPISPLQRQKIIEGNTVVEDEETTWSIDLLCDPTTISLDRLETLAVLGSEVLVFSQIVFVANGGYVESKNKQSDERLDTATCFGSRNSQDVYLAGFVFGATSETIIKREAEKGRIADLDICLKAFSRHDEAVRALCVGDIDFYFADQDITEFYRQRVAEATGSKCDLQVPQEILSYEPYAFLASSELPGFRPEFIASLYEMFSDGTAALRFASHFPDAGKSTALNLLFRINSVPGLRDATPEGD